MHPSLASRGFARHVFLVIKSLTFAWPPSCFSLACYGPENVRGSAMKAHEDDKMEMAKFSAFPIKKWSTSKGRPVVPENFRLIRATFTTIRKFWQNEKADSICIVGKRNR